MLSLNSARPCTVWCMLRGWPPNTDLPPAPRIAPHVTITLVMLETINKWEKDLGF